VELLQKLQVTIDGSQKERVREYQRRCEDALAEILLKGTAPPVSTTACHSMQCLCQALSKQSHEAHVS
jgi:hypothetical protein